MNVAGGFHRTTVLVVAVGLPALGLVWSPAVPRAGVPVQDVFNSVQMILGLGFGDGSAP